MRTSLNHCTKTFFQGISPWATLIPNRMIVVWVLYCVQFFWGWKCSKKTFLLSFPIAYVSYFVQFSWHPLLDLCGASLGFLWDFHHNCMKFLWCFYGETKRCPWNFNGIPVGFQRGIYGFLWNFYSMGFIWDSYRVSMVFLLDSYSISMRFQQDFCGIYINRYFYVYGISMGFLWDFYWICMVVLSNFCRNSRGCLWGSYRNSIGFSWDFYGNSMALPGYSCGISLKFL